MSEPAPVQAPVASLMADGTVVIAQAVLPVWGRQLDVIHEQLNSGITELTRALVAIDGLHGELAQLRAVPAQRPQAEYDRLVAELQAHIEQAVSGLQIGDRLSQMLTLVRGDMQRLIDHMPLLGDAGLHQAEQWLEELRARYTTPEQHSVHGSESAAPDSSGVDYF
ncbi:hypothetical protein [Inhella proteolytica]|uniref:Chemotaxis protein n=1 Tax=Inhella proteolytica TaxID=2795029 RepID=A0A931JBM9_9BURK|nr:hypothetical protein [Inhella proteolytica]MBH9579630.1 hypothetical protein [Inhella proteolytica]